MLFPLKNHPRACHRHSWHMRAHLHESAGVFCLLDALPSGHKTRHPCTTESICCACISERFLGTTTRLVVRPVPRRARNRRLQLPLASIAAHPAGQSHRYQPDIAPALAHHPRQVDLGPPVALSAVGAQPISAGQHLAGCGVLSGLDRWVHESRLSAWRHRRQDRWHAYTGRPLCRAQADHGSA